MAKASPVQEFERAFGEAYRVPYVLAVNSGAAALLAALAALDVAREKVVLIPAYSWPQVASVPQALGYGVECVDVDGDGKLDIADLQVKLSDITKTRSAGAIIVCHLFGNPSAASAARQVADRYGIPVIEDCSQALFARDRGKLAGAWGSFGFCSTGGSKPLSTQEGGLLWTSNPRLYASAYALTQHNQRPAAEWLSYRTLFTSLSLRMHPAGARQGIRSLHDLEERLTLHSARCEAVRAELRGQPGVGLPEVSPSSKATWQHCPALLSDQARLRLKRRLSQVRPAHLLSSQTECCGATAFAAAAGFLKV